MSTIFNPAKGDTGPYIVTVPFAKLGASGLAPYHTGSGALYFYGKLSVTDPDTAGTGQPQAVFKKTLASGITVTTDGNNTDTDGKVSITLDPADTNGLPDVLGNITLFCALKGNDGSGHEYTIVGTPDAPILLVVGMTATSKVS